MFTGGFVEKNMNLSVFHLERSVKIENLLRRYLYEEVKSRV